MLWVFVKPEREIIELASALARDAHVGQLRRDEITPYIIHVEEVAAAVRGDPKAEAIAWLHDVVEHTAITAGVLRLRGIPEDVIETVLLLTHRKRVAYEAYILRIKSCPTAAKIKVADIISNLSERPSDREIVKYARGLLTLLS